MNGCTFNLSTEKDLIYCGVMKLLADMPSCLGGEDHRKNVV